MRPLSLLLAFPLSAFAAPAAATLPPTDVTPTSATLNASANLSGQATTGYFRIGTGPGPCNQTYGTRVPATGGVALGSAAGSVPYSVAVAGLTAGSTYYFCAAASNLSGTGFGP